MHQDEKIVCWCLFLFFLIVMDPTRTEDSRMECRYGERGSLTVYCINATAPFIKASRYRYDHLDETLKCINCNLDRIDEGTFDIASNQIKTVDISNSSIRIINRKAFIGLVFMETLYLSNNPIIEIYPGAFSGIRKVKHLEMENCISQLRAGVFQELIHLNVLILSNNNMTTIEEGTFDGLGNLKTLDLSKNKLLKIGNIFTPLVNLEILGLQNNMLKEIEGSEFSTMRNLLGLFLDNNRLRSIKNYFPSLNKLQTLQLANNSLSEQNVKLKAFRNLYALETLDISFNNFSDLPNKFFFGLMSLRILNLYGNSIKEFSTGKFSGLPHLRQLNLSHNQLETAKVSGRLALTSLHKLDLSKNHIHSFDTLSLIERFPKLSEINLSNNNLSCEVYMALKELFQKDNIYLLVTEENLQHCKPDPKLTEEKVLAQVTSTVSEYNPFAIFMLVLLIVIIVLVGALYYFEFRILSRLRDNVRY